MADPSEEFCYYRVLHNYTPPDEYLDKGYLTIVEGDLIKVPRPVELEQGTEKHPEGWLKGINTKDNLEGYFPSGDYVQYVEKNPILRKSVLFAIVAPSTCKRRHSTKAVFFVRPILCSNCQDYIWGTGAVGVICKDCGHCFHSECESDAVSFGDCSKSLPAKQHPIHDQPVPLSRWDISNVADWMAVVNLHRYAHIFMKYGKKGDDLSHFTMTMLKAMKIEDEFHQKSILACIEKLCSNNKTIPKPMVEPEGASKDHHNFSVYSFSSMQQCHLCSEYLWGIIQQGYQCRNCGLCCHRKCVVGNLPKCSPEKLMHLKRSSFMLDAIFGMSLVEQFDVSSVVKAPPVVIRFTQELEKRAQENNIKAADAYRLPGSTAEVNRLKRHISEVGSIEDANLESFDHVCIAGALKKYLRDLPNAVIHEDFYSRFVEESKIGDDEQCKKNLMQLVEELPPHHCTTLKFLLEHFARCMQPHSANDDKKDAVGKLSRVFCQILIRPPWESIIAIVFSAEASLRVISLLLHSQLLQSSTENPTVGPSGIKPPSTPVLNADSRQPYSGSVDVADWYWKDISKEELNERMSNTQDGTFLVRDSSDGVKENYTLALRKGGSNRLLKIYHRDGKFGLMEPLAFPSVISMINHYMQNSLSHFNKTLDIKLQSPICRPKHDLSQEDPRLLKVAYVKADKEYNEELKRFEKIHEEHDLITEGLQVRHMALDAFKETLLMFDENMKIVMKNQRLVPQSEVVKARDNFELLQRQSKSVAERLVFLEKEIKQLTAESKVKFKDMNIIRPDLQSKGELRDQLRQRLINHGETPQKLDQLVVLQEQNALLEEATSHSDTSTWLVNFDRKKAVELLVGKPDGTFLIRPRNEEDWPYGLTIVTNGEVVHCKIGKKDTGYGFADPFFIHETLSDLVMHYKDTSLVEHNDVLDVMLEFPALGTVFTKQSNQIQQTLPDKDSASHYRTLPPAIPTRTRREHNESYVS